MHVIIVKIVTGVTEEKSHIKIRFKKVHDGFNVNIFSNPTRYVERTGTTYNKPTREFV